jgi:hypothetical protein
MITGFWVVFALALVVAFNIWPNLSDSPSHHPYAVMGFLVTCLVLGLFLRKWRKQ